MPDEVQYVALRKLKLPNPGQTPSSIRFAPGDIFSLDGSEGINVEMLLQSGAAKVYVPKPKRAGRKGGEA